MKMFLIADNPDTCTGMRLAGIEGVVANDRSSFQQALSKTLMDPEVGVILVMERFQTEYSDLIDPIRLNRRIPLILEIPDRNGTGRNPNFITDYVGEAIGLKL